MKKEAVESKIDTLMKEVTNQRQAINIQLTAIETMVKNHSKQQSFLQNLVLDLKNPSGASSNAEQDDTSDKCVLCLDQDLALALNPCGHVVACQDCEERLPSNCPICRNAISNVLRIYFP